MKEGIEIGISSPSIGKMIQQDGAAQGRVMWIVVGLVLAVGGVIFGYHSTPRPGLHVTGYLLLAIGLILVSVGTLLLTRRINVLSSTFVRGVRVQGQVTKSEVFSGSEIGSSTALNVSYTFLGRKYEGRIIIPYDAPLSIGEEVAIVVDSETPDSFVIRDSYESKYGVMADVEVNCIICDANVPKHAYPEHLSTIHPMECEHTHRLLRGVFIVLSVSTIAGIASYIEWGSDWEVVLVVIGGIVSVLSSLLVASALDKRNDACARTEWMKSHKGQTLESHSCKH